MSSNGKDVGQYIVNYFIQKDNPVTNLKLQKLLYYAWIDYFRKKREYLFLESFQAWVLGPVLPTSYYDFCAYGADEIFRFKVVNLEGIDLNVLNASLERYGKFSAYELADMTHHSGGAWEKVFDGGRGRGKTIDFELMKRLECRV